MHLTVLLFLVIGALVAAIISTMGKCPLWVATILLCIVAALEVLPLR